MKRKLITLFIALMMIFSFSEADFAAAQVGISIDPIDIEPLTPEQFVDMQLNGLKIPVTGYVQYSTSTTNPKQPKLTELYVEGQISDDGINWVTLHKIIEWDSTPLDSESIRSTLTGREFEDDEFGASSWTIYNVGNYRVWAKAVLTATGTDPVDTEEFIVEKASPTFTVHPMAAPNIAEIILEAEGVEANQAYGKGKNKTSLNLIQKVAHRMNSSETTYFNCNDMDEPVPMTTVEGEIEVCNPDYWAEVLCYLNKLIDEYNLNLKPFTYTFDDYVADQD